MNQDISFFVEGNPVAKQSFRVGRAGGRVMGFTPARVKGWQQDVGYAAQLSMRALGLIEPIGIDLAVQLAFFLKDARRIDSDNLSKCVLDGLNRVVWNDDKQVIALTIDKYICRQRQGVLVRITSSDRELEISLKRMENLIYLRSPGWAVIGVTV